MGYLWRTRVLVVPALVAVFALGGPSPAMADPVGGGSASAYAITASLAGTALVPPTPASAVTAAPFGDDDDTAIPVDASPLLVNGTLKASAAVHQTSDLASTLEQAAAAQAVEGPYNARSVGQIEGLDVLLDTAGEGIPLVNADLIRGEAVAVCSAGAVHYSASSEVVNLVIGGQDPLSGPLNDLVAQIAEAIQPLAPLVDIDVDTNVVAEDGSGATVDALVIKLLAAAGDPLLELHLGHAEVKGVGCGTGHTPECSDSADNDGDAKVDAADPGCHSDGDAGNAGSYVAADDSEADGPACSDKVDNDGDAKVDAADPGCHSDGDAGNAGSYVAGDTDEADVAVAGAALPRTSGGGAALPRTGAAVRTGLAAVMAAGAAGLFAVRRRLT